MDADPHTDTRSDVHRRNYVDGDGDGDGESSLNDDCDRHRHRHPNTTSTTTASSSNCRTARNTRMSFRDNCDNQLEYENEYEGDRHRSSGSSSSGSGSGSGSGNGRKANGNLFHSEDSPILQLDSFYDTPYTPFDTTSKVQRDSGLGSTIRTSSQYSRDRDNAFREHNSAALNSNDSMRNSGRSNDGKSHPKVRSKEREAHRKKLLWLYAFRAEVQKCFTEKSTTEILFKDCISIVRILCTAKKEKLVDTDRDMKAEMSSRGERGKVRERKAVPKVFLADTYSYSHPTLSPSRSHLGSPSIPLHTSTVAPRMKQSQGHSHSQTAAQTNSSSPSILKIHSDITMEEKFYLYAERKYGLRHMAVLHVASLLASIEGHCAVKENRKKGAGGSGVMVYGTDLSENSNNKRRVGVANKGISVDPVERGKEERMKVELRTFLAMFRNEVDDDFPLLQSQLLQSVDQLVAIMWRAEGRERGGESSPLAGTSSSLSVVSYPATPYLHPTTCSKQPVSFSYSFAENSPSDFSNKYLSRDKCHGRVEVTSNREKVSGTTAASGTASSQDRVSSSGSKRQNRISSSPQIDIRSEKERRALFPDTVPDYHVIAFTVRMWMEGVLQFIFSTEQCFILVHQLLLLSVQVSSTTILFF